ncbi:MAG: hypothetical protein EP314_01670 [Bacteroidetes bacterium]|nr:MAG: hypothetical protein EP314_01670 [Bacteroidota bacterium]
MPHYFFLLSIPIISALVGWLTNKLAVYMTFYPLEYRGRYPFGWQGIIPAKSHKMATKAVTLVTSKLISVEEQFEKLNAHGIVEEMRPQLDALSRTIVDEVMREEMPLVWRLLPDSQKEAIQKDAAAQFPATIENVLWDVKSNIHQLLDIDKMMIEGLTARPELLNTIFQQCGEAEFKFIERSGFVFGFLFGLVQMAVWAMYPVWWLLPLGGLVVGYLTNLLALKLIFRPVHPIKVGPFTIQGLFMKRQNEVSEQYARILTAELLTAEKIFSYVLETTGLEPIADLVRNHVKQLADNATGRTRKTVIRWTIGSKRFEAIKHRMAERLVEALPLSISAMFDYADRTLQIGETLETKLKSLSKEDFEDVLHPIFQEDELTLIIVGAVLGAIAGLIQIAFVM